MDPVIEKQHQQGRIGDRNRLPSRNDTVHLTSI
jgi:hypothetical protein